jgi:predicted nucleic acid-binding protein
MRAVFVDSNILIYSPRPEDAFFFEAAWDIEASFKLSWWDSTIVAAAQLSECRFLGQRSALGGRSPSSSAHGSAVYL